MKRRIPATDAYIEQLGEDPRVFLDFRMGKLNHAALVDSGSTRSYMRKNVAAQYYQAGGTLATSSFQTAVADGTTERRDHPNRQGVRIGGPAYIRHHGHPNPGSTPGNGPPSEARAHAPSRTAPMAVQRRNHRYRCPRPIELHARTGSPTLPATVHRTAPLPTDTRAHPPGRTPDTPENHRTDQAPLYAEEPGHSGNHQ